MIQSCCLTIAGSDSGGNAGVQADLRAFHAFGLHGCTVFAALTAQNPFGVEAVENVSPAFVDAQLHAVLGVYRIAAAKTGMLSDPAVVRTVAERLHDHREIRLVVDPVMVATSGARLVPEAAVRAIAECLLPQAALVTPNVPEAEILWGHPIPDLAAAQTAARALSERFGAAFLVKGGHARAFEATDVLYADGACETFTAGRIADPVSTHGTGCSLSAALAAGLALGKTLSEAVTAAKAYVHEAIRTSYLVGENCGVLSFPNAVRPDCRENPWRV